MHQPRHGRDAIAQARRTLTALLTIAAVVGTAAFTTQPHAGAQTRPDLGGVWQLNRDRSAPAGGASLDAGGPPGGGGRGGGGRMGGRTSGRGAGGGSPGRGGAGGGQQDQQSMQRLRETMRELMQPALRVTIVQRDDTVSFTDDQGRVRKFTAHGKGEKHQLDAATLETTSRWQGDALVIAWDTGGGATVIRRYRVDAARQQLSVETTLEGGRGPGTGDRQPITHVYDAVLQTAQ